MGQTALNENETDVTERINEVNASIANLISVVDTMRQRRVKVVGSYTDNFFKGLKQYLV